MPPLNFSLVKDPRFLAGLLSILLSLWAIHIGDPVNPDGILYLRSAEAFLQQGFKAAMQIYPWPFYSLMIALLSQGLHIALENAAHCINIILCAMICMTFVTLVKELKGSYAVQFAAAAIILAYSSFNHDRAWIIRDFGYWAFFLLAILQLIRYGKGFYWRHALGWGIGIVIASAFRIEGMIFSALLPLALLGNSNQPRIARIKKPVVSDRVFSLLNFAARGKPALAAQGENTVSPLGNSHRAVPVVNDRFLIIKIISKAYVVNFICVISGLGWVLHNPAKNKIFLGRITELLAQMQSGLLWTVNLFQQKAQGLSQQILNQNSMHNASTILAGGLIAIFIVTLIKTLTPLYCVLSGYAWWQQLLPADKHAKNILMAAIFINFFILINFLAQQFFLDTRYVISLCLLMMLWAPFALVKFYREWRGAHKRLQATYWMFPLIFLVMSAMFSNGVSHFGYSKAYITQAGKWVKQNTLPGETLYTNSKEILFYAQRSGTDWEKDFLPADPPFKKIADKAWLNYDYLALRINHDQQLQAQQIATALPIAPLQVFQNKRGDKVVIYKVKK